MTDLGIVGVWMRCPHDEHICGAEGFWLSDDIQPSTEEVAGTLTCANGHRWRITKVSDDDR